MSKILDLIQQVNKNLENQNKLATPANYEKEFFRVLKDSDIILEDFVEFQDFKTLLNDEEKSEFKKREIGNFKELCELLINRIPETEIKQFLKHLSFYMSPSISNKEINSNIYEVCTNIAKEPKELIDVSNIRKLRNITNNRIFADKTLFNEKTNDVKELIVFLDEHLIKILSEHTNTLDAINEIKTDINDIKLSESSSKELVLLKEKLYTVVEKLEKSLEQSSCELKENQTQCKSLEEQIKDLQDSLNKAEEEKSIDFLTGVLTRRAYELEVAKIENEYKAFDSKYAIVFFDIDHFKKINDSYGHDCGDVVLSTFAKILNKLTRTEDIVTRYGGEEFIALVHYKNKIEITNYLSRAKNIITNNMFKYKDIKLNVHFSAGVTFRSNYDCYEECIKMADTLLYQAKNRGRNKIISDTGIEM